MLAGAYNYTACISKEICPVLYMIYNKDVLRRASQYIVLILKILNTKKYFKYND